MRSNDVGSASGEVVDGAVAELAAMLARLTALADAPTDPAPDGVRDGVRIDRIALLERLRAAVAAAQQTEMVGFARSQVDAQLADPRFDPRRVGRGIADQLALACRVSPFTGSHRLSTARALHAELPATRALLATGRVSEDTAALIVTETRHLDPERRAQVDKQLSAEGLDRLSPRQAAVLARRSAYRADPAGYVARGRTARGDRRVSLRPAPDTMTLLTGFLPVEQGVACLAALRARTDALLAAGDTRSRGQLMADTMVQRLTGQAAAGDVNVEVGIVMSLDGLLDPDHPDPAEVVGHGPIPGGIARDLLVDTAGRRWWRRLFTATHAGPLVGGDPRRRRFDGFLAQLIGIRDHGRCRDPFCDAPIRHTDHVRPHRLGGPTSLANGRGVCARGNYVRELPGWAVELTDDGLGPEPHSVATTTPTGHTYTSRAGPAP